jgi:methylated-DNA-[protein]-cysteine S-methyltransferase
VTPRGFALFDTAVGTCAAAWSDRGLVGVQLPESSAADTRARFITQFPTATELMPPPDVQDAIERIVALIEGMPSDLSGIRLDMDEVPEFDRRVYEVARTIPPGSTLTYGAIAAALGAPGAARSVGGALGRNPFVIVVPCHRVVAAGGKPGGFSAPGGVSTKLRLLSIERGCQGDELPLLSGSSHTQGR